MENFMVCFMKSLLSKYFVVLGTTLTLILSSYAEVIKVCNSCGYEIIPATARFCGNCGEATDGTQKANNNGVNNSDTTEIKNSEPLSNQSASPHELSKTPLGEDDYKIIRSAIDFYMKKANEYSQKSSSSPVQNSLTSYYFLLEADGLLRLLPPDDANVQKRIKYIATSKANILKDIPRDFSNECPICKGSGYTEFHYLTHDGKIEKKKNSLICSLCNLRTTYPKVYDYNTLNRIATQAKFIVHQQKETNEFVQAIIDKQITTSRPTVPQKAAYAKATAMPCDKCFGYKAEQCKNCKGLKIEKCKNDDCDNGYKKEAKSSSGKNDIKKIESLRHLQPCEECNATTYIKCEDCYGIGATTCKQCNGTGSKEICKTCEGIGYSECTRCKKYLNQPKMKKRACTVCNDTLLVLCKTCDGAGVK